MNLIYNKKGASSPKGTDGNNSVAEMSIQADVTNISEVGKRQYIIECTRCTQTTLTFPPVLPKEVEEILARYNLLNPDQNIPATLQCTSSPLTQRLQPAARSYSRIASIISNTSGKMNRRLFSYSPYVYVR